MLKVVLVDDNIKSMAILQNTLLELDKSIEILGTFTDTSSLHQFIISKDIDCLFIDFKLVKKDESNVWQYVQNNELSFVFTSIHTENVLLALNGEAIGYLLKPFCREALKTNLRKIRKVRDEKIHRINIQNVLNYYKVAEGLNKKIGISVDGKILFVYPSEIIYCESDGNYCSIFLINNKKLFVTKKLKDIQQLLPEDIFYRIHHSYVINLKKVKEYLRTDGYVVLEENKRIPVSRQKRAAFLEVMV